MFHLTSLVGEYPVRRSQQQASEIAQATHGISGLGLEKPLAFCDHGTQSWRTYEDTFLSDLTLFSGKWPASGMTQNGKLFPQPQLVRLIVGIVSSSWPTPTAVTRPMEGNVRAYRAKIQAGKMTEAEAEAILGKSVWEAQGKIPAIWPTPTHGKLAGGSGAFQQIQNKYENNEITLDEKKAMQAGNGGRLNPMWVEWLMGFPLGWTDLED